MYILSEYVRRVLLVFSVASYINHNQYCIRGTGFLTKTYSLNQQILCALLDSFFRLVFKCTIFLTTIERNGIFLRENANENNVLFL